MLSKHYLFMHVKNRFDIQYLSLLFKLSSYIMDCFHLRKLREAITPLKYKIIRLVDICLQSI